MQKLVMCSLANVYMAMEIIYFPGNDLHLRRIFHDYFSTCTGIYIYICIYAHNLYIYILVIKGTHAIFSAKKCLRVLL